MCIIMNTEIAIVNNEQIITISHNNSDNKEKGR